MGLESLDSFVINQWSLHNIIFSQLWHLPYIELYMLLCNLNNVLNLNILLFIYQVFWIINEMAIIWYIFYTIHLRYIVRFVYLLRVCLPSLKKMPQSYGISLFYYFIPKPNICTIPILSFIKNQWFFCNFLKKLFVPCKNLGSVRSMLNFLFLRF